MDDEVGKARGRRGDERRGRKEEGVDENDRRVADVAGRGARDWTDPVNAASGQVAHGRTGPSPACLLYL
jgi:hypothetical protein